MEDLFTNYSVEDIVIFLTIFVLAMKQLIVTINWFITWFKKLFNKEYQEKEEKEEIKKEIDDLNKFYKEKEIIDNTFEQIGTRFKKIDDLIEMLIDSDKESIKAYITEKHHYFVYEKNWIDDYSLDCLEKMFAIYEREHGNTFVEALMNEVRELPKCPPANEEHKYIKTAQYQIKQENND